MPLGQLWADRTILTVAILAATEMPLAARPTSTDRTQAIAELQAIGSTSYNSGGQYFAKYVFNIITLNPTEVEVNDYSETGLNGREPSLIQSTTWRALDATNVKASHDNGDGPHIWHVRVSGKEGAVQWSSGPTDTEPKRYNVLDWRVYGDATGEKANHIADLLRAIAVEKASPQGLQRGTHKRVPAGTTGLIVATVDSGANSLGSDGGSNYVHLINTGTTPVRLSVWTYNCTNLEVAMCGPIENSVLVNPGADAGFWINRNSSNNQAWSYTVGCSVNSGAAAQCDIVGGGGTTSP